MCSRLYFSLALIILSSFSIYTFGTTPTIKSNEVNAHPEYYKRTYTTMHIQGNTPTIDGKLNDNCWQEGIWSEDYIQQTPVEGGKATERTKVKVLFDEKNIYVAFRCYDSEPDKIQRYIGKRDELIGDMVGINFDSYFDHRTGYEFNITAGGSKIDLLLKNDGTPDMNWNAVWLGKTAMEDSAWTAEMQIPLSQLRYNDKPEQIWGMHSWRWISRHMEEDQWSLIPRNNTGFIYSFGELHGIKNLPNAKRVEFLPYTLAKLKKSPIDNANPLSKRFEKGLTVGLDGRIGIGSDFTLDYTINPDFGQVEADPSVMNLSAFETFYEEKRPFFLEGKNVLEYNLDNDKIFYSRRIGRQPHAIPDEDSDNKLYVSAPANTAILNAVKFSGKTSDGLSIGVMQSTTNEEYAKWDSAGIRKNIVVEPYSNYFLGRVQKDYNSGNTIIGGIVTSTNRNINNPLLNSVTKSAYSGGLDFIQYFKNRNYYINLVSIFSRVEGKKEALLDIQESSVHYYQRPDAKYLGIDSSMTSLNGNGGNISFGKAGRGKWRFEEKISWRSPGLELNDMGYLQMADFISQKASVTYHETKPGSFYREYSLYFENFQQWNFGNQHEMNYNLINGYINFSNKWGVTSWIYHQQPTIDSRRLRGGPALRANAFWHGGVEANTDWSKNLVLYIHLTKSIDTESNSNDYEISPGINIRLSSKINVDTKLYYNENHYDLVYVETADFGSEKRYIMGRLKQKTLSLTMRLNYNLTPDLSVQYYGSPFISAGDYYNFKQIINPMATLYRERFSNISETNTQFNEPDNTYRITEGNGSYTFDNPDFNMKEFRSNFVIRWEYKSGSAFYFVWAHQRSNTDPPYNSSMSNSARYLLDTSPDNTFIIKFNYYFAL
jgi:hypothetical protein